MNKIILIEELKNIIENGQHHLSEYEQETIERAIDLIENLID